jgi:hypothetical protein
MSGDGGPSVGRRLTRLVNHAMTTNTQRQKQSRRALLGTLAALSLLAALATPAAAGGKIGIGAGEEARTAGAKIGVAGADDVVATGGKVGAEMDRAGVSVAGGMDRAAQSVKSTSLNRATH